MKAPNMKNKLDREGWTKGWWTKAHATQSLWLMSLGSIRVLFYHDLKSL